MASKSGKSGASKPAKGEASKPSKGEASKASTSEAGASSSFVSRHRQTLAFAATACVAGGGYYLWTRHVFANDVAAICSAETGLETTIQRGRSVVESAARKKMQSSPGVELIDALKAAPPDVAATKLEAAAKSAGVSDCTSAASYRTLSQRLVLRRGADTTCRKMDPLALSRAPRAERFSRIQDWAHTNVGEPALDDFLTKQLEGGGTPAELAARLRTALSDLDIHECGMMTGLVSQVDPTPGPNVVVQSTAVQNDTRESAVATALRAKLPMFRQCYEAGLNTNAALAGSMSIKFRLTETGAIDFATIQDDSTLIAPKVVACVVEAVKSAEGPPGPTKNPGGIILQFWVAR